MSDRGVAVEVTRGFDVPGCTGIGADEAPPSTLLLFKSRSAPGGIVLPEDMGLAVGIEIAGTFDMHSRARI
jgi:hypothetical protein